MRPEGSAATALRQAGLDLLALPLADMPGISRSGGAFVISQPWTLARYGRQALAGGWWQLLCRSDQPGGAELRLSSAEDPLIVVSATEGQSARIYLRTGEYDVSMLVSAWPGAVSFGELAFRRLGAAEEAGLVFGAVSRLAARKGAFGKLLRAGRRYLAGQSVGLSLKQPPARDSTAHTAPARTAADVPLVARKLGADGSIIAVLRNGDRLHDRAAALVVDEFARNPQLSVLYGDAEEGGRILPHPAWDRELTKAFAYPDAPFFVRAGQGDASIETLATAVARHGENATARIALPLVQRGHALGSAELTMPAPEIETPPRVSVILPTKYQMDLLRACLAGLAEKTGYPNVQVIVVDNGAEDPRFPGILEEASKTLDLIKVEDFGPFNFSRLINNGVRKADGDILLLLNDDVVPQEEGWLHRMVDAAMQPTTGAVGARLTYADGSIQHAGVALGLGGVCGHLWKGASSAEAARNPYIALPGSRMAVTAACLAVRREAFDSVGGFDEDAFGVALNDIDFCLKLHASGLRNIYRGDAWLIHHESQSRGDDDMSLAKRRRLLRETRIFLERWGHLVWADPWSSPAFDPRVESGAVHPAAFAPPDSYEPPAGS